MRISDWSSDVCSSDLLMLFLAKPSLDRLKKLLPVSLTPSRDALNILRINNDAFVFHKTWNLSLVSKANSRIRSRPVTGTPMPGRCIPTANRSAERRVGKEGVGKGKSRGSPYH